jgi:hypothetical protein
VLSVLLSFSFEHCVVCSSVFFFWALCCLFFCLFLLSIVLSVLLRFTTLITPVVSTNFSCFSSWLENERY